MENGKRKTENARVIKTCIIPEYGFSRNLAPPSVTFFGSSFTCVNNFDTSFNWVDFTISLQIKGNLTSSTTRILTLGRSPSNFEGELTFSIVNNKLQFWDYGNNAVGLGFADSITGIGSISSGVTTHIAFVKQGTTGKFYINGQIDKTITSSSLITYTKQDLCYGGDYRDNNKYFTGTFSGLVIYREALTSSDISDIYNNVFQVPSAAPTCTTTDANTGTFALTSNTDVLMVDFDVTLNGASYSCVSIASASISGPYTKQIGFNFKMVSSSTVANNIMEIFFTGGGVSHYFGGPGNSFDFADTLLASYPASFTPITNAICMGSYTSGTISLPAGFTKICIGNGHFECSVSVQFIGQLQVYGFQTATEVSIPATIPACQVVGGGYQLSGVLTKSPCPPGQYSMGGVLACTSCARGA
eukprot:gene22762-29471_t